MCIAPRKFYAVPVNLEPVNILSCGVTSPSYFRHVQYVFMLTPAVWGPCSQGESRDKETGGSPGDSGRTTKMRRTGTENASVSVK